MRDLGYGCIRRTVQEDRAGGCGDMDGGAMVAVRAVADSESGEDYSFLDGVDFGYDAYIAAMNQLADHYLYINHIDYANHTYTVDDYKNMKYLSENDLIGYYNVLGEEESEKVVQALGYDGWDDYLTKNNYLRDGKPSFIEWERQLHIAYHKLMSEQNK